MNGMRSDYTEVNKIKKFCNKQVFEKVSQELNVDEKLVEEIFDIQSEFAAKVVKTGAFESVTFVYLGKLKAKLNAISKIMSNPRKEIK